MNIKLERMGLGLTGIKAVFLSLLFVISGSVFASEMHDEHSLVNRLKEFNQPIVVTSVTTVSAKKHVPRKSTSTKKPKSRKYKRACYKSSASTLRERAEDYQPYIRANSKRYAVDESLIIAVITAESCFAPRAKSHKGAQGLMQLIPATAKRFGVRDAYKPSQNIQAGTKYLRFLLKRFSGNMEYAVAGYNAGEGAVDRYGGIPPYRETKEYVRRVMAVYNRLKGRTAPAKPHRKAAIQQAVFKPKKSAKPAKSPRGNFIKPDYKWKRKQGKRQVSKPRVSRAYQVAAMSIEKRTRGCRDTSSKALRRTTDLIKRTHLWRRHYTVKQPVSLSSIARATGTPVASLLRLNRGISRLKVKAGRRVLVWQCSTR